MTPTPIEQAACALYRARLATDSLPWAMASPETRDVFMRFADVAVTEYLRAYTERAAS